MTDATQLINSYISMWNETDPSRRRALIAETVTETATYVDPLMTGDGIDGIDGMIAVAQTHYPDHRFTLTSGPEVHHGHVRFSWSLAPDGRSPVAHGTDVADLADDGRMTRVIGFLDQGPED